MSFLQSLIYLVLLKGVCSLELRTYTACYGTTGWDNFLQINCGAEKIAPMGFFANAKLNTSNCPDTITFTNKATTPTSCCEYDPADCEVFYRGSVYQAYYKNCNGETQCNLQVSWVPTPCNTTVYIARTNYMKLDYYCVSNQALDPCTDFEATDSPTFLWNSGYPSSSMSGSGSCSCSVEVDCDTTIQITAIHLQLSEVSGGGCRQFIEIEDSGSTITLGCGSNNDYLPTLLYTSTSHFIQITIIDNLGSSGGNYFLAIQGTNPSGSIRLSCGSTLQNTATTDAASLPECPGTASSSSSLTTLTTAQSATSLLASEYSSVQTVTISDTDIFSTYSQSIETGTLSMDSSILSTDFYTSDTLSVSDASISTTIASTVEDTGTLSVDDTTLRTDTLYTAMSSKITSSMPDSLITPTTLSIDDTGSADFYTTMSTNLYTSDTGSLFTTMESYDSTSYNVSTDLASFSLTDSPVSEETPTLSYTDLYGSLNLSTLSDDLVGSTSVSLSDYSPSFTSIDWSSTEGPTMSSVITTPICCKADDKTQKEEGPPIWVAAVVVLVVIIGIVTMLILYREKIRECCFKEKTMSESKEKITGEEEPKTDHDEVDAFGPFVPTGKAGALPPILHAHPLQRENTLTKRPLSPIRFQMEKGRTSLDLTDENLVGRRHTVKQSPRTIQSKTRLPPLEVTSSKTPAERKGQRKGKKKRTKNKSFKGKRQPKVEQGASVKKEPLVEKGTSVGKGIQGEVIDPSRIIERRKSLSATIDVSDLNGSLESSVKIDVPGQLNDD